MNIQQVDAAKLLYLKKVFEVASKESPSNPYSVYINPYELGKLIGFDTALTERVAIELANEGSLRATLGLGDIALTERGVNFLRWQESNQAVNQENTYDAYYVSLDTYEKLKQQKERYRPHYECYLKIQVFQSYSSNEFTGRILLKSRSVPFEYLTKNNGYRYSIIKDYDEGRCELFTFDGYEFYQITDLKSDAVGIYKFTFKKYSPMGNEENNQAGVISISNIHNSTLQVQNHPVNSKQSLSGLDSYGWFIREIKEKQDELAKHLEESRRRDLVLAVEYLESQFKSKNDALFPGIVKSISEILKSVPTEVIAGILSDPILKMLGF